MIYNDSKKTERTIGLRSFGIKPRWWPLPKSRQKAFIRCPDYDINPFYEKALCFKKENSCINVKYFILNLSYKINSLLSGRFNFDEAAIYKASRAAAGIFNGIYLKQPVLGDSGLSYKEIADMLTMEAFKQFFNKEQVHTIMTRAHCLLGEWSW